eukprot:CAMPEP_0170624716 /NCGR_PEP_ID=MMETSP0224-20130122/30375_1 /TAXON_ID=285029 /ORGANISM="Togula jolla, Strain CCCM 725" /LENGTH=103 /DNA_ID=CAMNT_0010951245 /DNA_START=154 /DNA_END=466 /DNA_ORIENTATION=+
MDMEPSCQQRCKEATSMQLLVSSLVSSSRICSVLNTAAADLGVLLASTAKASRASFWDEGQPLSIMSTKGPLVQEARTSGPSGISSPEEDLVEQGVNLNSSDP